MMLGHNFSFTSSIAIYSYHHLNVEDMIANPNVAFRTKRGKRQLFFNNPISQCLV